jgi:hypothetical protein
MPDIVILFFVLGLAARCLGSTLRMPTALYESLSIYLLLAIGLKGGIELARLPVAEVLPQVLTCVLLGFSIPFLLVPLLRRLGFTRMDSAGLAAHYGSVSVVTFAIASAYLERTGVAAESHAALWLAVMEAPALISGILLARSNAQQGTNWRTLGHEVMAGPSVMLLVGGLVIGAVVGAEGAKPLQPLFMDPFKGVLCLFMLELGRVVGERLPEVRRHGRRLLVLGLGVPPVLAVFGAAVGVALGLSAGGIALLATLAGSASYIAAPAAVRLALPEANAALAVTASLAITFPFNVIVGIPLYARLGAWWG